MSRALLPAAALMAAAVPASALEVQPDAGVQWHELREHDTAGRTLVREQGWAPRLGVTLGHSWSEAWSARAFASGWVARASYDGQAQSGAAMTSHTDTQSASTGAALQWRPGAMPALQLELGAEVEHLRRRIASVGGYSGLDERLTQPRWRLGATWRSGGMQIGGTALWGEHAPLSVRFDNGLFDEGHLRSGRAHGLALDASWALGSAWRIGIAAETLKLDRSAEAALMRGGALIGTVTQPSWRRERVSLQLQRPFGD